MSENNISLASTPTMTILKDIIAERKAERRIKAEQQRQSDLKRIKDMKSTTGIHPLEIFPKEIWMQILKELNPQDLECIWQIHPMFRYLLRKVSTRDILFPLVLQLDELHSWVEVESIESGDYYYYEKLRCVSKPMRNSLDHWMANNLMGLIHGEHSDRCAIVRIQLENSEVLDKFLALLHGESCAEDFRIFRRGLRVYAAEADARDVEVVNQFFNKITKLLQIIGNQIWNFAFIKDNLSLAEYSFPQVYTLLKEWISLMPNLKHLEINLDFFVPSHLSQQQRMPIAHDVIRSHPIPRLAFLEKITLCLVHEKENIEMLPLYSAIVEANQHVTSLEIEGEKVDAKTHLKFLPVDLIKSLKLTGFSIGLENLSLDGLGSIVNFYWQLGTIVLKLEKSSEISLVSLFRLLENFPTLENVTLELPERQRIEDSENLGYLALPNLTKYEMSLFKPKIKYKTNIHYFFSLQFLLHCEKLKTIKWIMHDFNDVKLREHLVKKENRWKMIDFRAGLRFLYESNIWDVFPSLQTVQVEFLKQNAEDTKEACQEKYKRGVRGEGLSVGYFLKDHVCCKDNRLRHCAILFG